MLDKPVNKKIWLFVIFLYLITCLFVYQRVYVYKDYPIFTSAEEIPTMKQLIIEWFNKYIIL